LGDEYHYIFECTEFINERKLYFDCIHLNRHNIIKQFHFFLLLSEIIFSMKLRRRVPDYTTPDWVHSLQKGAGITAHPNFCSSNPVLVSGASFPVHGILSISDMDLESKYCYFYHSWDFDPY
jgi:hypothetical protein